MRQAPIKPPPHPDQPPGPPLPARSTARWRPRCFWLALILLAGSANGADEPGADDGLQLTLLSFNAWGMGAHTGTPLEETRAVLRAVNADIIGLQETRAWPEDCAIEHCAALSEGRLESLARDLGYHYHENTVSGPAMSAPGAILSRFPIVGVLGGGLGVRIDVAGRRVHAWNIHPTDFPYQPYQLAGISYGEQDFLHSPEAAIDAARRARGEAVAALLGAVASSREANLDIVFGDFNEPSHRDWTERAAAAGVHPFAVRFPQTRVLESAGFIDAYRAVFPDELAFPGFTWTPITAPGDPTDHHDRIDFVFVRGIGVNVSSAMLVGEASPPADLVVTPWPSDHRAVRVTIRVN